MDNVTAAMEANATAIEKEVMWLFTRTETFTMLDFYCVAATVATLVTYHVTTEMSRVDDRYNNRRSTSFEVAVDAGVVSWVKNATHDKAQRIFVVQCLRTSGMVMHVLTGMALLGAVSAAKNSLMHHHWAHRTRHIIPCMLFVVATLNFGVVMIAYYYLLFLMPLQEMEPGSEGNPRNATLTHDEKNNARVRSVELIKQATKSFRLGWKCICLASVFMCWVASPVVMLIAALMVVWAASSADEPFSGLSEEASFPVPEQFKQMPPPPKNVILQMKSMKDSFASKVSAATPKKVATIVRQSVMDGRSPKSTPHSPPEARELPDGFVLDVERKPLEPRTSEAPRVYDDREVPAGEFPDSFDSADTFQVSPEPRRRHGSSTGSSTPVSPLSPHQKSTAEPSHTSSPVLMHSVSPDALHEHLPDERDHTPDILEHTTRPTTP